jgi:hypothetical protein
MFLVKQREEVPARIRALVKHANNTKLEELENI